MGSSGGGVVTDQCITIHDKKVKVCACWGGEGRNRGDREKRGRDGNRERERKQRGGDGKKRENGRGKRVRDGKREKGMEQRREGE